MVNKYMEKMLNIVIPGNPNQSYTEIPFYLRKKASEHGEKARRAVLILYFYSYTHLAVL